MLALSKYKKCNMTKLIYILYPKKNAKTKFNKDYEELKKDILELLEDKEVKGVFDRLKDK
ncbi:hypothetical protein [Helicobacter sp. 11S02629-2]|uniref:hypothetical protein n=1 Tax=Helicobacter sp. 11S02629-2 TaxID=1476195 RepID=UPI000BA5A79D|nr:hypothetical protein [Helicobacter sp. 11S02629-2]PAF44157.1 hypothetical protein BKH40_06060 [Helicobacter sp. 11S02629-2]